MSDQASDPIPEVISAPADEIADFCRAVVARHSEHWPVTEDVLAEEFLTFFGLEPFLTFEGGVQFCRLRLRIPVSLVTMPRELRGFNGSYRQNREILISVDQGMPNAKLYTLLHEIRELIEFGFQKIGHPVAEDRDSLEIRAEAFASSVQVCSIAKLMPQFLSSAAEIQKKWMRVGAYILVFAGAILYCLACASFPRLEDAFADEYPNKRQCRD